jgi:hypothetical protein
MEKYFFLKIAIYYLINLYILFLLEKLSLKKKKIFFLFLLLTI